MSRPFIIVVEGCNAAGKSFTLNAIKDRLIERGLRVRCYKAPDYDGLHGKDITQFLRGEILSGDLLFSLKSLPNEQIHRAVEDFAKADCLFRENRLQIQKEIEHIQREDCDVVIIDRWSLSAVVYSKMRFREIGHTQPPDYFKSLTAEELTPDLVVLLEEAPGVIVQRMNCRMNQQAPPFPVVWTQPAVCFERTMKVFSESLPEVHKKTNIIANMGSETLKTLVAETERLVTCFIDQGCSL